MSKEVKTVSRLKIALIVVSTLFVISLIANLYLYTRQYGITPDSGLENQIANLQSEYDDYVANHHHTDSAYDSLESERDSLKTPQLHLINYDASIHTVGNETDYVSVEGTIFNSGVDRATNVVFTIRIYDSGMTLIETKQITFGNILGKSHSNFADSISAEGANSATTELTYD